MFQASIAYKNERGGKEGKFSQKHVGGKFGFFQSRLISFGERFTNMYPVLLLLSRFSRVRLWATP